jgi:hypothetical protein
VTSQLLRYALRDQAIENERFPRRVSWEKELDVLPVLSQSGFHVTEPKAFRDQPKLSVLPHIAMGIGLGLESTPRPPSLG